MDKAIKTIEPQNEVISMVERLTLDPNVDVEKLQAIINMKYTEEDRQAEREYTKAMVLVQENIKPVTRDKHNAHTKSSFVSYEAMQKVVVPAYTNGGFALSFSEGDSPLEGHVRVNAKLAHKVGHSEKFFYDCPIDDKGMSGKANKTPTHGKASAVSYAKRYITGMIFNVTIQDEDDDGNGAYAPVALVASKYEDQLLNVNIYIQQHIDGIGSVENSQMFIKTFETIPLEIQNHFHDNLPSGNKSAIKKAIKEMTYESNSLARNTLATLIPLIEADDSHGVQELLEGLIAKTEKRIVWNGLTPEQAKYLTDLADE